MKISFWSDRNCMNKLAYLLYKMARAFFVSFYFYFYPPLSILLTFLLPFVYRSQYKGAVTRIYQSWEDPEMDVTNKTLR